MNALRLVGDIGGTHARFALASAGMLIEDSIASLPTAAHASLLHALTAYLRQIDANSRAIAEVRIAIAGPVNRDDIAMTNANWHFSVQVIAAQLRSTLLPALASFIVINDFAAQALALPRLHDAQLLNVGRITPQDGTRGVLGPGTGFGAAFITSHGGEFVVLPSEGGHAGIAADTAQEVEIFAWLLQQQLPVTRETLLSGSGLERLHDALDAIHGRPRAPRKAPDIVSAALAGDAECRATLTQFCQLLGNAARDQALIGGTRGGVYIAGGIVLHFIDFFMTSDFRRRFDSSPLMADYLRAIPTYLVNTPNSGLIGAANAA